MKHVYAGLGFLFFGLAALGAFVPVLPTTPFLLLASFFFLRSSERLNTWFTNTDLYKRYLANYMDKRCMTLRGKIAAYMPGFIAMSLVAIFVDNMYVRIAMLALIALMTWYFIARIKTISPEEAHTYSESLLDE